MPFQKILLLLLVLFAVSVNAQPGWQDFTNRYYYTILDKKGKVISFQKNKKYRIVVDSVVYRSPNIPTDSLPPVLRNSTYTFDNYIRINDFSLRLSQERYNRYIPLEIKIIHKKDTMYLNQITGVGSGVERFRLPNTNETDKTELASDFTLKFIAGHYHFPDWAKMLWSELPKVSGNVRFVNLEQRHFLIPKVLYNSLAVSYRDYRKRYELNIKAQETVVDHFLQGYLSMDKKMEPTKIENPPSAFYEPLWDGNLYPTKDKDVYFGQVRYNKDSLHQNNWKYMFSIYNKKDNSIRHWYPKKNLSLFANGFLHQDLYNGIVYQVVWMTEKQNKDQSSYIPPKQELYVSDDEGKSWTAKASVTQTFRRYNLEHVEFLDKNHALSYGRREEKHKTRNYKIKRVTYYLLKDMKVVDSLKMPNDNYDSDNYIERHNQYRFRVKDTIPLGIGNYEPGNNLGERYFQANLIRTNSGWQFSGEQKVYERRGYPKTEKEKDTVDYRNFKLINKKELCFNNGAGTLRFSNDVCSNLWNSGVAVLEKDNRIYLLDNNRGFTYISFDGGASFYIYPIPLETRADYRFMEIDDQNVISFFNPWKLYKMFYTFSVTKGD